MWQPEGANAPFPARAAEALARLAERQRGPRRHAQPVAVIGPGDGGPRECEAAYAVGRLLAGAGMAIVCGGRGGVMAAASRGAREGGGIAVGILPEDDDRHANPWLSVAVPTGMGEMRNAVIARSGVCLVAVGGGMGTLSEMALGLKWGKPVFALYGDIALPGAVAAPDLGTLMEAVAACLLE
ncbi:TIGR00725 family protein [Acidovorax sp. NCPPB 2350]|nr:TIGR00725 family protein [Acidovorax sp. NCPPB 2350]